MNENLFSSLWSDLCYAARTLRQNPGFAAVAVLAIALGIGVNAGIFTVLNGAALRSLPVPDSAKVVSVYQIFHGKIRRNTHGNQSFFSTSEYQAYRADNHVFSGLLAYSPDLMVTLGGDRPRQLYGQLTSCNYFGVLNEPPALGRAFLESDCAAPGSNAVVVLSDDLWRSAYGADPAIAGKKIILNRQLFTVAGVAPPGFQGTEPVQSAFWAPFTMQRALEQGGDFYGDTNMSWLVLMGRSKAGVPLSQVRADLGVIAGRIDQLYPGRKTTLAIQTATLLSMPEERQLLTAAGAIILAAVGMVLLIACANVANLLLARAAGRQKEIAIRLSVGASRGRLIRQLLTESLFIALIGGALGSAVAFWSFNAIMRFVVTHLPNGVPPLGFNVGPDLRVLGYSLTLTILTGMVFGLAPALKASQPDLSTTLKSEGAGLGAKSGGFLRQALVCVQVTVCMVLLIAAGLLLRALYLAQTIDPGFEMKNVSAVSFDLRGQGYNDQRAAVFERQLMERLAALPGVDAVAQAGTTPLSDNHWGTGFTIPGESQPRQIEYNNVTPEYFSMLNIPIVRGRSFTGIETNGGARVAIVTESAARSLWPGQDAVGKALRQEGDGEVQIVGVAKDTQVAKLGKSDTIYLYLPAGPKEQLRMQVLVHGAAGFASISNSIQAAARAIDPDLLVDVERLEDNLENWRTPSRIVAILAGSLGALALLLAATGIYGVVSFAVSRRVKEIGIRMTLGADARSVMRLILRQAMRPVVLGAVLGIAASAGVSQVLSSMLFGMSTLDPVAFVLVPLFLMAVALLASYVPASRATRVDPMVALRYE